LHAPPTPQQAIFQLDKPWEAEVKLRALRAVLGGNAGGDAPAAQLLADFRLGEERVRRIVLGSPAAPGLAATPPAWAACALLPAAPCVPVSC
jgi:hypothetical protein